MSCRSDTAFPVPVIWRKSNPNLDSFKKKNPLCHQGGFFFLNESNFTPMHAADVEFFRVGRWQW